MKEIETENPVLLMDVRSSDSTGFGADRMFSVVIADDDELVVDAMSGLIDDHPALRLAGVGRSGHEAARLCAHHQPHLVVLDVAMPLGGLDGLAAVREVSPDSVVVFYTAQGDRRTRERLVAAGASAVLSKGAAIDLAGDLHDLVVLDLEQRSRRAVADPAPDPAIELTLNERETSKEGETS